jgi:hypothetical protein
MQTATICAHLTLTALYCYAQKKQVAARKKTMAEKPAKELAAIKVRRPTSCVHVH